MDAPYFYLEREKTMKTFQFKNSFEEIKINERVYKVDLSDDKVRSYQAQFVGLNEKIKELQSKDTTDMSLEEQNDYFNQSKEITKEVIESVLGKDSFDPIYEESGRSLFNMLDLLTFLSDLIGEKTKDRYENKVDKYIKNKKKK